MTEYLDQQLREVEHEDITDIFDAGVTLPGEEDDKDHDKLGPRTRRRRTAIFVGHGDFMSLVLKRIVAGFGHAVEKEKVPHRSAFVHFNTGITELEYFGNGRFLVMSHNTLPHLSDPEGSCFITGGSLKDGWSYLMPSDGCLDSEVSIAFSDEIQPNIQEQTEALRSLYLAKKESTTCSGDADDDGAGTELTIVVKRGLQVVGCAQLNDKTGRLSDVVVRPSARRSQVGRSLIDAVKNHAKQSNIEKIVAQPDTLDSKMFFEKMGFSTVDEEDSGGEYSSTIVRMECKL
jgi:GNAT superfamily N-acetyltransferase